MEGFEGSGNELRAFVLAEAQKIADEDVVINERMAENGAALIEDGDTVIHHCNTGALATVDWGTALGVIRKAHERGLPVLGHCLGGQLICKALGGMVTANPVREIGWYPVRKTLDPATDSWLAGIPEETTLFHWHGETFSIPDGAVNLLENDNCAHQAFAIGNTLALQCHVEMTAPMVREWATEYAAELTGAVPGVQSAAQMTSGLQAKIAAAQQAADAIYQRWLQPLCG